MFREDDGIPLQDEPLKNLKVRGLAGVSAILWDSGLERGRSGSGGFRLGGCKLWVGLILVMQRMRRARLEQRRFSESYADLGPRAQAHAGFRAWCFGFCRLRAEAKVLRPGKAVSPCTGSKG